jgi:hypothetical protein
MHSIIMDPTVGTSAGFIVEPTDVLTMEDIHIPMEVVGDMDLTPMEAMGDMVGDMDLTPMEAMGDMVDMVGDMDLTPMEAMGDMEDIIVGNNFGPHRRHVRRV